MRQDSDRISVSLEKRGRRVAISVKGVALIISVLVAIAGLVAQCGVKI